MKKILLRFARVTISTFGTAYIGSLMQDPRFVFLTPVITALGAAIRVKYPKTSTWLPF